MEGTEMKSRLSRLLITLPVVIVFGAASQTTLAGQQRQQRPIHGQPDIQGLWTGPGLHGIDWTSSLEPVDRSVVRKNSGSTIGAAPQHWMVDGPNDQSFTVGARAGNGLIIDPPDHKMPLQPWAAARKKLLG